LTRQRFNKAQDDRAAITYTESLSEQFPLNRGPAFKHASTKLSAEPKSAPGPTTTRRKACAQRVRQSNSRYFIGGVPRCLAWGGGRSARKSCRNRYSSSCLYALFEKHCKPDKVHRENYRQFLHVGIDSAVAVGTAAGERNKRGRQCDNLIAQASELRIIVCGWKGAVVRDRHTIELGKSILPSKAEAKPRPLSPYARHCLNRRRRR
jgi:hypothetical protein